MAKCLTIRSFQAPKKAAVICVMDFKHACSLLRGKVEHAGNKRIQLTFQRVPATLRTEEIHSGAGFLYPTKASR